MKILRQKEFGKIRDLDEKYTKKLVNRLSGKGIENDEELYNKVGELAKSKGRSRICTDYGDSYRTDSSAYYPVLDFASIDAGTKHKSSSLAHELGHSQHTRGRSNKFLELNNKLGDKLIRERGKLKLSAFDHGGSVGGAIGGFVSGYRAGLDEKKDTAANKILPYVPTIITTAPTLIEEADASRRGLKLLKEAGANKKQMRAARRNLGVAFGTYALRPVLGTSVTYAARNIGKRVGARKREKKESKNENTTTKEI